MKTQLEQIREEMRSNKRNYGRSFRLHGFLSDIAKKCNLPKFGYTLIGGAQRLILLRILRSNKKYLLLINKEREIKMKEPLRSAKDQAKYEEIKEQEKKLSYGCFPLLVVCAISWVVMSLVFVGLVELSKYLWSLL